MESLIGQTVSHYRVVSKLGAGANGAVYKAEHLSLGIPVALKFIHPEGLQDPETRVRFAREAKAAAVLDHTSICKVFDFDQHGDYPFFVMDYVDGVSLRDLIAAGPLPLGDAVAIAVQICAGLLQAHGAGIIHRDIKPSNLMITHRLQSALQVKILDFGVARSPESTRLTQTRGIVGTATYMSPEQAQGFPIDRRTDLWSVGVCLYEMVTGRVPFAGDYELAVQYAVVHAQPTPVGALRPEAPPELRRIINRALHKSPAGRYQDAGELLGDLQALEHDLCRPLPPFRAWLWKYRNRLALALGGLLLLAVLRTFLGPLTEQKSAANPFENGRTRQLTRSVAGESEPSLSPDGRLVAFTTDAAGNLDICWVGLAGGEPVRVTDDPADDSNPAWLADGSGIVFGSQRQDHPGIWKTDLSGKATQLLIEDGRQPALSPDGRWIAFSRLDAHGNSRIFVADLDDPSRVTPLTGDNDGYWDHENPAWSPDGRFICYGDYHDLWQVPADGGVPRRLTSEGSADQQPFYSPDGRHVYFESFRDGTSALWRVDLASGVLNKLTPGSGPEGHPGLDRTGSRLVYTTSERDCDVELVDRQRGLTHVIAGPTRDLQPAVSVDGTLLVFVSARWSNVAELWLQHLEDGAPVGEPVRLVEQDGSVAFPDISPDNRWVAYYLIHSETRSRDIWIAPIPAGRPERITTDPAADVTPGWSADGRRLAFASDRSGTQAIYVIPIEDGKAAGPEVRITPEGMSALYPKWSPDGATIAFQVGGSGGNETWLIAADGSTPPLALTRHANSQGAAWVADRGELWVSAAWNEPGVEIRSVDPTTRLVTRLDPPLFISGPTLSARFSTDRSGRSVVYQVDRRKGDIWLLEADGEVSF